MWKNYVREFAIRDLENKLGFDYMLDFVNVSVALSRLA